MKLWQTRIGLRLRRGPDVTLLGCETVLVDAIVVVSSEYLVVRVTNWFSYAIGAVIDWGPLHSWRDATVLDVDACMVATVALWLSH